MKDIQDRQCPKKTSDETLACPWDTLDVPSLESVKVRSLSQPHRHIALLAITSLIFSLPVEAQQKQPVLSIQQIVPVQQQPMRLKRAVIPKKPATMPLKRAAEIQPTLLPEMNPIVFRRTNVQLQPSGVESNTK